MALEFNGTSDNGVITASADFLYDADFTINIWLTVTSYANSPYIHDYSGTNNVFVLAVNSDGALICYKSGGINISGGTITAGKLHMATASRISGNIYLSLDGVGVADAAQAGDIGSNSVGPIFGKIGSSASNFLAGNLVSLELYKGRGLTIAEVATKYASRGSDNITNGLVYRALLNEGTDGANPTATQPIDVSGKSHVFTVTTSAVYRAAPLRIIK